ncbi:3'-5' exonuclease [bacterium]|nr:3'-5' exonuclease [bacterium]
MFYLSLDVEASGPFPGLFSLVSVGCVPVLPPGPGNPLWTLSDRTFYCEFKPLPEAAELPAATEVHGLSTEHLQKKGLEPQEGMQQLADYLAQLRLIHPKFMTAAWPASFDQPFIGYYAHRFLGSNPFGYACLDIASLAQGLFRCERRQLRSRLARRGLFRPPKAYPHHALDDANDQAVLLVELLNLSQKPP